MTDRRGFIAGGAALAASAAAGSPATAGDGKMIWAVLLHLGVDMWIDYNDGRPHNGPPSSRQFDDGLWNEISLRMRERGLNTLVLDLGEGFVFPSHPELAVKGAWTPERMRKEVARLKTMGIDVVPKINFSTAHDSWFKDFGRMVSTKPYYDFCRDIIRDAAEVFPESRLFHIGMDEEDEYTQSRYRCCIIRQGDLWWHDLDFFAGTVASHGKRPWMWSDYAWTHPDYCKRCSREILQSNWFYSASFERAYLMAERERENGRRAVSKVKTVEWHEIDQVECYEKLEKAGFDQIPCGGNWRETVNMAETVKFCREKIAPERLKGFLVTSWRRLIPEFRDLNLKGVDLLGDEIDRWNKS